MAKEFDISNKQDSINFNSLYLKATPNKRDSILQNYKIKPISNNWKEKSKCTIDDKMQLLPLIIELLYFHIKSEKIGLLGIYDSFESITNLFLYRVLSYVLDGYPASQIDTIFTNEINNGDFSETDLKEKILIKDGCLSLLIGNSPQKARDLLFSILDINELNISQNVITETLTKWRVEKEDYFNETDIQSIDNILQFRKD